MVAILDLITGFPNIDTAYIGWFMINKHVQGTGIGKRIMEELFSFLAKEDFKYVRLGCIKENIEGMNFWRKHQFQGTGFEDKGENYTVVGMDRTL